MNEKLRRVIYNWLKGMCRYKNQWSERCFYYMSGTKSQVGRTCEYEGCPGIVSLIGLWRLHEQRNSEDTRKEKTEEG